MYKSYRQNGFTLIELMIVIAIIAIILTIGLPMFKEQSKIHKLDFNVNNVYFDLILAKTKAMEETKAISVCFDYRLKPSNSNATITYDYIIIDEPSCSINNNTHIIKRVKLDKNVIKQIPTTGLTFNAQGFASSNLTLTFSIKRDGGSKIGRHITINRFGKITSGKTHEL